VAGVDSPMQVAEEIFPDVPISTPIVQSMEVGRGTSGDIEIVPSFGDHTQSSYTSETEKVASSSPNTLNQLNFTKVKFPV